MDINNNFSQLIHEENIKKFCINNSNEFGWANADMLHH